MSLFTAAFTKYYRLCHELVEPIGLSSVVGIWAVSWRTSVNILHGQSLGPLVVGGTSAVDVAFGFISIQVSSAGAMRAAVVQQ